MSKPILGYLVEAATKLFTPRKIGGVDFDGTGDINLPGVNEKGNQDTTGTADKATTLVNARAISIKGDVIAAGIDFNGSAEVELDAKLKEINSEVVTKGSKNKIPVLTVDKRGLVTSLGDEDIGATAHYLVNEVTTIQAEQGKTYNLSAIMGTNASKYDVNGLTVVALVKDTDASSPTHNYFINSESVLVVGVSANQLTVVVHNAIDVAVEARIKISVGAA